MAWHEQCGPPKTGWEELSTSTILSKKWGWIQEMDEKEAGGRVLKKSNYENLKGLPPKFSVQRLQHIYKPPGLSSLLN